MVFPQALHVSEYHVASTRLRSHSWHRKSKTSCWTNCGLRISFRSSNMTTRPQTGFVATAPASTWRPGWAQRSETGDLAATCCYQEPCWQGTLGHHGTLGQTYSKIGQDTKMNVDPPSSCIGNDSISAFMSRGLCSSIHTRGETTWCSFPHMPTVNEARGCSRTCSLVCFQALLLLDTDTDATFVFILCINNSRVLRNRRRKCIDRNEQTDDFLCRSVKCKLAWNYACDCLELWRLTAIWEKEC